MQHGDLYLSPLCNVIGTEAHLFLCEIEVFTATKIQVVVLRDAGVLPQHYTASQPRKLRLVFIYVLVVSFQNVGKDFSKPGVLSADGIRGMCKNNR
jgi:hypothetical protein